MRLLTIIPTYNERENIGLLVTRVLETDSRVEVLVVDDHSPDGTAQAIRTEHASNPRVHLLERPGKLGLGTAYAAGFRYGLEHGYDLLITMDADFSHDPATIPDFLEASRSFDMVIGSRYIPGGRTVNWGVFRKLISKTANLFAHAFLSLKPADCTSGYRLFRAETLKRVNFDSIQADGYSYLLEFAFRAQESGISIGETPIVFQDRRAGKSKISRKEILKALETILRLRFSASAETEKAPSRI